MDQRPTCRLPHIQLQWTKLLSTQTCPEPLRVWARTVTVEDVTTDLLINSDRLLVNLYIINFCFIKMAVFFVLAEAKAAEAAASSTPTTFAPMRVYLPEVSSLT